ncbi:hypothetical protein NDU88_004206 [Pleurodeles waltl]|uniref:t-SNARE coiled-coil homology domain-containing protein n=1 Tax=Pleurodeles waltl TaxID=8319 RepID=A0AAV7WRN1_PLEWA|nr:hypothetical protein NDU88_004206 [Pleurodeles waltl]
MTTQAAMEAAAMEAESPTLHVVMEAIKGIRTSLESQIDSVMTEVDLLRVDLRNMGSRVKEVADAAASLREDAASLKTQALLDPLDRCPQKKKKHRHRLILPTGALRREKHSNGQLAAVVHKEDAIMQMLATDLPYCYDAYPNMGTGGPIRRHSCGVG